jgi:hypothetical protein
MESGEQRKHIMLISSSCLTVTVWFEISYTGYCNQLKVPLRSFEKARKELE